MEDLRKSPMDLKHKDQPMKTEFGPRCVVFTYYHGDINTVVDEHFSRALSNTKDPQDLSIKTRNDEMLQKNVNNIAADEMNCTSQWTKPYQTTNPLGMTSSVLTQLTSPQDHYPTSVFPPHHNQPTDLWHFHHIGTQNPIGSVYHPHSMPEYQMIPGAGPDGKCGSLLSLLHTDRYQVPLQESMIKQEHLSPTATGHHGTENVNQRMNLQGGLHPQERSKDFFHPQDRRKDLFFY
ncbi:transcription cofactor vestigial-like protein 1 [Bombina bombina]|uniref:transcription cofactor vestigial-like protein 1 n=1 Tax=Bombina bombina TaxID=8345 RepID=UPI00235A90FD|nr:transcription cofactor vestigial-like protein 1 [Bombina bombina]